MLHKFCSFRWSCFSSQTNHAVKQKPIFYYFHYINSCAEPVPCSCLLSSYQSRMSPTSFIFTHCTLPRTRGSIFIQLALPVSDCQMLSMPLTRFVLFVASMGLWNLLNTSKLGDRGAVPSNYISSESLQPQISASIPAIDNPCMQIVCHTLKQEQRSHAAEPRSQWRVCWLIETRMLAVR